MANKWLTTGWKMCRGRQTASRSALRGNTRTRWEQRPWRSEGEPQRSRCSCQVTTSLISLRCVCITPHNVIMVWLVVPPTGGGAPLGSVCPEVWPITASTEMGGKGSDPQNCLRLSTFFHTCNIQVQPEACQLQHLLTDLMPTQITWIWLQLRLSHQNFHFWVNFSLFCGWVQTSNISLQTTASRWRRRCWFLPPTAPRVPTQPHSSRAWQRPAHVYGKQGLET